MLKRFFPVLALAAAFVLGASVPAAAFEVTLVPENPQPGDILSVEIIGLDNPARAECVFGTQTYPFYPVAPGKMRALIGLTAKTEKGVYSLRITRRRFLLPDVTQVYGITVPSRKFTHQYITMPKKKTRLTRRPGARKAIVLIRSTLKVDTPRQFWRGPFLRPAKGRRSSSYGHTRTINRKMSWDWHKGIDIAARSGHPVRAPDAGRIVLTGRFPVQGGMLILDHGQGLMSAFLHLKSFEVREGQKVGRGAHIANVGGGGFSTGSHLHWGVYVHGAPVDPVPLLKRRL